MRGVESKYNATRIGYGGPMRATDLGVITKVLLCLLLASLLALVALRVVPLDDPEPIQSGHEPPGLASG